MLGCSSLLGHHLLLEEELALLGHEVLFLLLASLKCILLLGGQGRAKGRETSGERRLNSSGRLSGLLLLLHLLRLLLDLWLSTWHLVEPRSRPITSISGRTSRRIAWQRNQKRLPCIANLPDKSAQLLEVTIFLSLDCKVGREKSGAIPLVHLKTSERTLNDTGRIAVYPLNLIRHDHDVLRLWRQGCRRRAKWLSPGSLDASTKGQILLLVGLLERRDRIIAVSSKHGILLSGSGGGGEV